MFTGLIKSLGRFTPLISNEQGLRARIEADGLALREGDSIAVNGVCLTALNPTEKQFEVDISPETLRRTKLAEQKSGSFCNLEPALCLQDPLGGHLVQGHVDDTGEVTHLEKHHEFYDLRVRCSARWSPYLIEKGSIAVDGVSLTVNALEETESSCVIQLMIIPHTWKQTSFQHSSLGQKVHLEFDMIAKYVEKQLQTRRKG